MEDRTVSEKSFAGPWLPVAVTGLWCAFTVFFLIANTDIRWHLAAGREMVRTRCFLYTDPFSVSSFGFPWINVHWLFQLAAYAVHATAGAWGLIWGKAVIFGLAMTLSLGIFRDRIATPVVCLAGAAMVFAGRYEILARPTVVSLLLAAVFIMCIEKYRSGGPVRYLWALAGLQAVWTNTQGLFILGPVIAGCYAAGDLAAPLLARLKTRIAGFEQPRRSGTGGALLLITAVLTAVCLINPYGWRVFIVPFKLFFRIAPGGSDLYSGNISENLPVWRTAASYGLLTRGFGLLILVSFLAGIRRISPARFLLYLVFLFLGSLAVRNVPLYVTVCLPVLAANLSGVFTGMPGRLAGRFRRYGPRVVMVLLAAVLLAGGYGTVKRITAYCPADGLAPFRVPAGAAAFLQEYPVTGTMFCSARHGGYLAWRLYPDRLVFTDGRFILRPPAFFRRYLDVLDHPEHFDAYSRQYALTHVLVPYVPGRRYAALAAHLAAHAGWRPVYLDGADVLFIRNDTAGPSAVMTDGPAEPAVRKALKRYDPALAGIAGRNMRAFAAFLTRSR